MEAATIPVIMKLTPNITNIVLPARAGVAAGANALSLINTINSIVGVDLDTLELTPEHRRQGRPRRLCRAGSKADCAEYAGRAGDRRDRFEVGHFRSPAWAALPTWQDAAQFLLLGACSLQVCTAVMHYGFRIIEDLCDGLSNWMDEKGFKTIAEVSGHSLHRVSDFKNFDLSFRAVARIDEDKCIKCDLCYVACNDTAHQCIDLVAPDGKLVAPRSYDVRSNGKLRRNRDAPAAGGSRRGLRGLPALLQRLPSGRLHSHGRGSFGAKRRDMERVVEGADQR